MMTTMIFSYIAGVIFAFMLFTMHPKYARVRARGGSGITAPITLSAGFLYGIVIFGIAMLIQSL